MKDSRQNQTWRDAEIILTGVYEDVFALASRAALIDPSERIPNVLFRRLRKLQKALRRVGEVAYDRVYDEMERKEGTTTLMEAIATLEHVESRVRLVKERCLDAYKEARPRYGNDVKVNPALDYQIDDVLGTLRVACNFTDKDLIIEADDDSNDGGEKTE